MHILPFRFPLHFSFIRFIASSDPFLCDIVRLSGYSAPITFMYSNYVYSLYMAATTLSPCFLISFLDSICENITSTAILWMSCIKHFLFFPMMVNWVSYPPPPKLHLKALNNYPCIRPSWPCVCGFALLSFHTTWFYFYFILFYLCIIILLFFYLFWLYHVFILISLSELSLPMVASSWSVWSWFLMIFPLRPFLLSDGYSYFSSWSYASSWMIFTLLHF